MHTRGSTRNFFHSTSGFTLFELMIVIAILALLYTVAIGFTQNPAIYREKSVRMQSYIEDQLKSARTDTMIGKGPRNGTNGIGGVQKREVIISSGALRTIFYTGTTNTGIEIELKSPFFEGDKNYILSGMSGTCISAGMFSTGTTATITYEQNQDIKIQVPSACSTSGDSIRTITFTTKYQNYTAAVTLDRISGIIKSEKPVVH